MGFNSKSKKTMRAYDAAIGDSSGALTLDDIQAEGINVNVERVSSCVGDADVAILSDANSQYTVRIDHQDAIKPFKAPTQTNRQGQKRVIKLQNQYRDELRGKDK